MFKEFDLAELQQNKEREQKLKSMLKDLLCQKQTAQKDIETYDSLRQKEAADVEALEGGGLKGFFFALRGNKEERLEKEREEAAEAQVKYEKALLRLEEIKKQEATLERDAKALAGSGIRYAKALAEKEEALMLRGGAQADRICRIEEEYDRLGCMTKELEEAQEAGRNVLLAINQVKAALDSAGSWGMVDMFGGGVVTSLIKHSHLDEADGALNRLQEAMSRYHTELADVTIDGDFHMQMDGFTRMADVFFDNLLFDWMVQSKIDEGKRNMEEAEEKVSQVQAILAKTYQATLMRIEALWQEREETINKAQ